MAAPGWSIQWNSDCYRANGGRVPLDRNKLGSDAFRWSPIRSVDAATWWTNSNSWGLFPRRKPRRKSVDWGSEPSISPVLCPIRTYRERSSKGFARNWLISWNRNLIRVRVPYLRRHYDVVTAPHPVAAKLISLFLRQVDYRRRGSPFADASDPSGSRNGSTGMRS